MNFLKRAETWVKESYWRTVEIKITGKEGEAEHKVWAYDYNVTNGKHIKIGDEFPTTAELMQDKIDGMRDGLEKAEKELEVETDEA